MADEEHAAETRKPHKTRRTSRSHRASRRPVALDPQGLPTDPAVFWSAGVNLDDLALRPEVPSTPVLPRLGPPPFPRGGFPLLGFLATVYEHVARSAGAPGAPPP
jgi:hypothetical protein